MAETILNVPDISCAHCVQTVTKALKPVEGIKQVNVDLDAKKVRVAYDPNRVDVEQMKQILAEEDYPVASVEVAH